MELKGPGAILPTPVGSSTPEQINGPITISLKTGNEKEKTTQVLLEQILRKYALKKWIKCREVIIAEGIRSHAFPQINLSTSRETEEGLLAKFLHEQIHWIESGKEEIMDQAIEGLRQLFPNVPVGGTEGGDNEKSTYRHLVVCRLQFLALCEVVGESKANEIISSKKGYTWIYLSVVKDGSVIDPIIERYFPEALK